MDDRQREVRKLESEIRAIHRDLCQARDKLMEAEQKCGQVLAAQPELEQRVAQLRQTRDELLLKNSNEHAKIEEKRRERNKLVHFTQKLKDLEDYFVSINSEFSDENARELSKEDEEKVQHMIDNLISKVSMELTPCPIDDYTRVLDELQILHEEADRELSVLEQIEIDHWPSDSTLSVCINDFCETYPHRNLPNGNRLSQIQVPAPSDVHRAIEVDNSPQLPPPPNLLQMRANLLSSIAKLQQRNDNESQIYRDELEYMQSIKDILEHQQNSQTFDISKFRAAMNKRIKMLGHIGTMEPVSIPDSKPGDSDPVQFLIGQISELSEELKQNMRNGSIVSGLEDAASVALQAPKFELPGEPSCVKSPAASPLLTKLTGQLRELSDISSDFIPINAVQSLVASHRAAVEFEPFEFDTQMYFNVDIPTVPRAPEAPAFFREFRECVAKKLPDELANRFDRIKVPAPMEPEKNVPVEVCSGTEMPAQTNIEERAADVNALLRVLSELDIPSVPSVGEEQVPVESPTRLDTAPLLEAVDKALDWRSQRAKFLCDEIEALEEKLASLQAGEGCVFGGEHKW